MFKVITAQHQQANRTKQICIDEDDDDDDAVKFVTKVSRAGNAPSIMIYICYDSPGLLQITRLPTKCFDSDRLSRDHDNLHRNSPRWQISPTTSQARGKFKETVVRELFGDTVT